MNICGLFPCGNRSHILSEHETSWLNELFSDNVIQVVQVSSVEEAWQVLELGAQSRHSAQTKMNERSSRSHCLLCVKVRGHSKLTGNPPLHLFGRSSTSLRGVHTTVPQKM